MDSSQQPIDVTADGQQRYIVAFPANYSDRPLPPRAAGEAAAPPNVLVAALQDALTNGGKGPTKPTGGVILDLAGVEYMNSAGIGAIFSLRKYAKANGARMVAARPTPSIIRLLNTVNLPSLIPVASDLDEARKVLRELNEALGEMEELESSAKKASKQNRPN